MSALLEFREKLKLIYGRYDTYVISILKFLLTFFAINMINGNLGYMKRLDNLAIVLIVSLLGSFLPNGCIILFAAIFSLLHMYELSMEVALVGLCLYLVMFLLYFRFSPKDSIVVLLTPLLCAANIPYVMPIAMGLLGTPASAVSVGCGIVIYQYLSNVAANAQVISAMEAEEAVAKLQLVLNALIHNNAMIVMIVAFAVTIIVVYLIRRLSVAYAWTIAIITGCIVDLIVLLLGDLKFDTNLSLVSAILGTILAALIAKVIEFFRFCVDYNRAEKVQFEDDEYYYYVRAIPKMTVSAQSRTVKKINTQRRNAGSARNGAGQRERGEVQEDGWEDIGTGSRRIVTERIRSGKGQDARRIKGRSVTINSNMVDDERIGEIMEDVLDEDMAAEEYSEDVFDESYAEDEMYPDGQEYGENQDYEEENGYAQEDVYAEDQVYAGDEEGSGKRN